VRSRSRSSLPLAIAVVLAVAAGLGAAGCGKEPPPPDEFLAFASNFNGFRDWPLSWPAMPSPDLPPVPGGDGVDAGAGAADGGAADGGAVHRLPLTVYLNMAPPHGSTTFPLGTIIVKETNEADITQRQVFAMVKRGADFNASGAVDWEWFDLTNLSDGTEFVSWHGYGPLGSADTYGGNPHVCNDCHKIAVSNDYVWSSALALSTF
jgi:hypothetical protein